jgi:hypothetical protein
VSHEYHFPATVGEAQLFICQSCGYAASVESCPPAKCPECGHSFSKCCSGIEVMLCMSFCFNTTHLFALASGEISSRMLCYV